MRILLEAKKENIEQLEDDLKTVRSEVVLPIKTSSWEVKIHNDSSYKHAETFWTKETSEARIRFYNRYFEEKIREKRITTFLHELVHAYLFSSEEKCSRWNDTRDRLRQEKIDMETKEQRYNIDMANYILGSLYSDILNLPLEFLAEECFKKRFSDLFHYRKELYYDLRTEWQSSFVKWQINTTWKGSDLVAAFEVYRELLKVRHFLKVIDRSDTANLSRFTEAYKKLKRILDGLCDEELLQYFVENEDKLTTVSLSPLHFPEKEFLELSDKLWSLPRTN